MEHEGTKARSLTEEIALNHYGPGTTKTRRHENSRRRPVLGPYSYRDHEGAKTHEDLRRSHPLLLRSLKSKGSFSALCALCGSVVASFALVLALGTAQSVEPSHPVFFRVLFEPSSSRLPDCFPPAP